MSELFQEIHQQADSFKQCCNGRHPITLHRHFNLYGLVAKRLRGHKLTERERKKLARTLADSALVIPVTILMLLPISAVGHAALFAAIKKYIPCLISSMHSSKRLDIVKQLNRTKKMEVQSWSNLEDLTSQWCLKLDIEF